MSPALEAMRFQHLEIIHIPTDFEACFKTFYHGKTAEPFTK